jgi:hypothetical protein
MRAALEAAPMQMGVGSLVELVRDAITEDDRIANDKD